MICPIYQLGETSEAHFREEPKNKEDGVLNEGIYLAKCGPTMTDDWEDPSGKKHKLPIEDYSPFLVADPESNRGKGSSGGPSFAVSEQGDIVLGFRGRGAGNTYDFMYTRPAGHNKFTERRGAIKIGSFWGNQMFSAAASRDGVIKVLSRTLDQSDWKEELEIKTDMRFGSSVSKLVDGILVLIVEDRSNQKTDRQKIACYAFKVGEPKLAGPSRTRVKRILTKRDDGAKVAAELIDISQGRLICFAKGRQFEIPISALSDEDKDFIKQWMEESSL